VHCYSKLLVDFVSAICFFFLSLFLFPVITVHQIGVPNRLEE